jgi:predicted nucleic acid-binding protein
MFPDNTVLVNFGHLGQMTLLEELVRGRGRWTATVAEECERSADVKGLEVLAMVPGFLGEPLRPGSPAEYLMVEKIRIEMLSPGDNRYKNLGEAETLAIMTSRFSAGAVFVSDDGPALRKATSLGVRTCTTYDLIALAARAGRLEITDAWNGLMRLRRMPRALPGCPQTYFEFQQRVLASAVA